MTFQQKLEVVAALSAGIAFATLARRPAPGAIAAGSRSSAIALSLAVVAASLIVVGFVSHTVSRHLFQIAPLVIALGLLAWSPVGIDAAAPLLAFWMLVMLAIWMFLLGIARTFSGTYTPPEIALTIIIAGASLWGLVAIYRHGSPTPTPVRALTIAGSVVLQLAAMWAGVLASR